MSVVFGGSLVAEDAISGLVLWLNQVFDDVLVLVWLCWHSWLSSTFLLPVKFWRRFEDRGCCLVAGAKSGDSSSLWDQEDTLSCTTVLNPILVLLYCIFDMQKSLASAWSISSDSKNVSGYMTFANNILDSQKEIDAGRILFLSHRCHRRTEYVSATYIWSCPDGETMSRYWCCLFPPRSEVRIWASSWAEFM